LYKIVSIGQGGFSLKTFNDPWDVSQTKPNKQLFNAKTKTLFRCQSDFFTFGSFRKKLNRLNFMAAIRIISKLSDVKIFKVTIFLNIILGSILRRNS